MKCVKCGMENKEGVVYCAGCGSALNNTSLEVGNTPVVGSVPNIAENNLAVGSPVQNTPVVSNNIQTNVDSSNVVDLQQPVVNNDESMQINSIGSDNSKEKKLKVILIVLIVVLVLVVGLAIFVFIAGQNKLKEYEKINEDRIEIIWTPDDALNKYTAGTEVTLLDDSKWYVISQNGDMITLLASETYGEKTHFSNSVNDYEKSVVKDIIENQFLPSLNSSLSMNNGNVTELTARIISVEEIRDIINVDESIPNEEIEIDKEYQWLYTPGSYWTSTQGNDGENDYIYVHFVTNWISFGTVDDDSIAYGLVNGNEFYIRPVIEVNVSNIK